MKVTNVLRRALPVVLVVMMLAATSAFAQFSASLSGTVEDPTGAVVANATVTLTNNGTQVQQSVTTSGSGFYKFSALGPGDYTIAVTATGFQSNTISNVVVAAETARDIDVTMAVGANKQTVTVNANSIPDLQTADASINSTIDSEAIERLPSFGADPYELLRTAPGITGDSARSGGGQAVYLPNAAGPGQSNSGIYQTENEVQISAAGLPIADNAYTIDGVNVNSLDNGGAAVVTPNVDSVDQITVVSSSFSAEDGRNSGAIVKTITKSGSNDIHGSARFQYDEPGLNAYNGYNGGDGPFPNPIPPERVDNQQRYYGGSLGGPIVKDKLFWFISGESLFQHLNTYTPQFVETPALTALLAMDRPGNIANQIVAASGPPRVASLLNQSCTTPVNIPGTGSPCAVVNGGLDLGSPYGAEGVYVPGSLLETGGGLDGIPDVEYALVQYPFKLRARQYNGRLDYYLSPNDHFAGSFYYTKLDNDNASSTSGAMPGDDLPFKPSSTAATFIYIHTFSASLLNDARLNYTRIYDNGVSDGKGSVNYGIPYINIQNMAFDQQNDLQYGVYAGSTTPEILTQNQYDFLDTVTKVFGSHSVKAGFEFRPEQNYSNLAGNDRPTYAIQGIWNFFNDTPVYESITASPYTGGPGATQRYERDHYIAAFVQHDWKVKPNLTVNMGVRWEYFQPIHNTFPVYLPVLGPAGSELTSSSLVLKSQFYNSEKRDFSPKVGFAWQPRSDPNMVVRAGFAMAYNRLPDALFDNTVQNGPGSYSFGICCGTSTTPYGPGGPAGTIVYGLGTSGSPFSYPVNPSLAVGVGANGVPNGIATNYYGPGIQIYGAALPLHTPYTYLYSLDIQRDLGHNFVVDIGYQGNESFHEPRLVNQYFVYPLQVQPPAASPYGYNGAFYNAQTDSIGNYNGMNVQLNRRFNRGLTLTAVYTWSKAMDEVSYGSGADAAANQSYPTINRDNYGPSDYDVQNRFTASGLWDLPTYKPDNKIMKAVTGGWQLNGIFTAHSGLPFSPVTYTIAGLPTSTNPIQISPVRPYYYDGTLNTFSSCGNDKFVNGSNVYDRTSSGSAQNNFDTVGTNNGPGVGRNSFRGPCYQDFDLSAAKQFTFSAWGHEPLLRFQANAYNAFNHTNLTPFSYSSSSTLIESNQFGIAQSADAGRVLEFLVRLQF